MKVSKCFSYLLIFVLAPAICFSQVDDLKLVRGQKFKLQNEIKNLISKRSEFQRNILYLQYEIEETLLRIKEYKEKISQTEKNIKKNLKVFVISNLREKNNDLEFNSRIEDQIYRNWKKQSEQISVFKHEMQEALNDMASSKKEMQNFLESSNSLAFTIGKEIDELNKKQIQLRYQALSDGPDSVFYEMTDRLYWPVPQARLTGSRGFYKVPGERVFNYNEGMKFTVKQGTPVYPIYRGIIEEILDVSELGQIIVVKHTENIRSFYIGASAAYGISKGNNVSPDRQIGLVKDTDLELKLRFDTESLDPIQWVTRRR